MQFPLAKPPATKVSYASLTESSLEISETIPFKVSLSLQASTISLVLLNSIIKTTSLMSPDDFFNAPGLLNNLEGTLTDSAIADNEMWMKKLQDLKNQDPQMQIDDKTKKRELIYTEEGRAEIFLNAISVLYSSDWKNLNITIDQSDDKVLAYLHTIENIAQVKLADSGWRNNTNVNKISQMITAAVALCTVGASKIPQLGYDFREVSNVFKSFDECKRIEQSLRFYRRLLFLSVAK